MTQNEVQVACLTIIIIITCPTVLVSEPPWPNVVYVPQNSTVQINCTLDSSFWTVDIPGDGVIAPLQFTDVGEQLMLLNNGGVYQLPTVTRDQEGNPPTLRLLINDTAMNNQTKIFCTSPATGASPQTTLFVYGMSNSSSYNISLIPSHF